MKQLAYQRSFFLLGFPVQFGLFLWSTSTSRRTISDWQGYEQPGGFPGKSVKGRGTDGISVTLEKPEPGMGVLAGFLKRDSQHGNMMIPPICVGI